MRLYKWARFPLVTFTSDPAQISCLFAHLVCGSNGSTGALRVMRVYSRIYTSAWCETSHIDMLLSSAMLYQPQSRVSYPCLSLCSHFFDLAIRVATIATIS